MWVFLILELARLLRACKPGSQVLKIRTLLETVQFSLCQMVKGIKLSMSWLNSCKEEGLYQTNGFLDTPRSELFYHKKCT